MLFCAINTQWFRNVTSFAVMRCHCVYVVIETGIAEDFLSVSVFRTEKKNHVQLIFKISAGVLIVTFLHYIHFNIFNNNNSLLEYIGKHQSFKANI